MKIIKMCTEVVDRWSPHFIPGKGTVVRYSDVLCDTKRVSQENFAYAEEACNEFAFEIAWLLDNGTMSRLDFEQNLGDIYVDLKDLRETNLSEQNRELFAQDPSEEAEQQPLTEQSFPPDYVRGNANTLAYLQWQIQGTADRLALLGGPEQRAAHLAQGAASNINEEYTSALDDIDSDEDALGGLFG